ncbi:MAG: cobyrinate a,c-diamide synthase, partial [Bacillota bacterium]
MKNIVVAGTESGVGKTTIALGLMASLTQKGYKVQPFKVGPDYIDPGFHSLATGVKSRNLDSYFLEDEGVKRVFIKGSKKADISIIEGVMGLFDGKGEEGRSSTAEIARILDAPVVLVMDVGKVAQSAAAVAYGYKNYDPDLKVQAIILNNIASQGHYQMIKKAIEEKVGIKVIGCLYKNTELKLSERHLGLVPTFESNDIEKYFNKLRKEIDDNIDIKLLLNIMNDNNLLIKQEKIVSEISTKRNVNIGIAYDQAFNFYYQENLDILKERGANLIYFSPVNDTSLPDVDGIYIGGGFPESFLRELAENREMKNDIYTKIKSGLPVYAECGGLMYLARDVVDFNKEEYSMVG